MVPSPPATMSNPSRHSRAASSASSLLPVSTQSASKLPSSARNRPTSLLPPPEDGLQITRALAFEVSILLVLHSSHVRMSLPRTALEVWWEPLRSSLLERVLRLDSEELDNRQPYLAPSFTVESYHGLVPVAGDVTHLASTHGRLDPLPGGEVLQEGLPQSGDVGQRERATEVGALVPPVGDEDARDAVEVCPGDLGDQARPNHLPDELALELRVLLAAPGQYTHHPRVSPPDRLFDGQPVHPTLVDVRVEPLLLPQPRDAQPILPLATDFFHVRIIPRNPKFTLPNFLQTRVFRGEDGHRLWETVNLLGWAASRRSLVDSRGFLEQLKRAVIGHPALVHPFLERFGEGDVSEEGVRTFAIQYYRHVRVSRLYLAALISNCGHDEKLQLALAEILFDEYGHLNPDETHPALYRRFLTALDITEEEWENPPTIPEVQLYISAHRELTRDPDIRLGLGAMGPASEWPVPPIYVRLTEGLKKAVELSDDALEIFTSHVTMDVTHARIMMDAAAPYAEDEESQQKVREGAMRSLDARSVMLDGLHKAVYGETAPLAGDASVRAARP